MDDPSSATGVILELLLLLALILVNAFFSSSEIAIISLNDNKIKKMADHGDVKAGKIVKLTSDSTGFLSTIQIGVTIIQFLLSALASENFASPLSQSIITQLEIDPTSTTAGAIGISSIMFVTLILSIFTLVLGELVPKRVALQNPEKIAFGFIDAIMLIKAIVTPFVKFLTLLTNVVLRLMRIDPNATDEIITEEEIRMLVDVGEEKGVIEESQKAMINNIFEFDDLVASEAMTHRTKITAAEVNDDITELIKEAIEEGYSRIPIYEDELDKIVGIVYVKDLLKFIDVSIPEGLSLTSIMRAVYFVPESKKCGELFREMTENHIHVAIVVDEYGGTAGMITMEDLIESILGNIQDEYDQETEEITEHDDSTFTIDGSTNIEEIEAELEIQIPDGEYDTLGGLILSELGRIPRTGETPIIEVANCRFTVLEIEDKRITSVKVEKLPPPSKTEKAKSDN